MKYPPTWQRRRSPPTGKILACALPKIGKNKCALYADTLLNSPALPGDYSEVREAQLRA